MNIDNLVEMANDIGSYFKSEPDHEEAVNGVYNHMDKFWEVRMQRQIVNYVEQGGNDLAPFVAEAVSRLKSSITDAENE
ncbi:MAG: formate dehydrogenase subunit delta [Gammaproteobacteria bacterium]|jgi:formate dehydrogenase subunit delta